MSEDGQHMHMIWVHMHQHMGALAPTYNFLPVRLFFGTPRGSIMSPGEGFLNPTDCDLEVRKWEQKIVNLKNEKSVHCFAKY